MIGFHKSTILQCDTIAADAVITKLWLESKCSSKYTDCLKYMKFCSVNTVKTIHLQRQQHLKHFVFDRGVRLAKNDFGSVFGSVVSVLQN